MRHSKKLFSIVALFLLVAMTLPAEVKAMESRTSSNIQYCMADVSVGRDGNLSIFFSIMASGTMDTLGASSISIQRYDGSRWSVECNLSTKDFPEMQTTDATMYTITIPYTPTHAGSYYRVVIVACAKNNSGTSTDLATSRQIQV